MKFQEGDHNGGVVLDLGRRMLFLLKKNAHGFCGSGMQTGHWEWLV